MDPKSPVNVSEFISNLLEEMAKLEGAEDAVYVTFWINLEFSKVMKSFS